MIVICINLNEVLVQNQVSLTSSQRMLIFTNTLRHVAQTRSWTVNTHWVMPATPTYHFTVSTVSASASNSLPYYLILILPWLFWTCIWNIQWRQSLYVRILCGLLSCDSSLICKKCWSCLCIPLHSWWRFGTHYRLWNFFTP